MRAAARDLPGGLGGILSGDDLRIVGIEVDGSRVTVRLDSRREVLERVSLESGQA